MKLLDEGYAFRELVKYKVRRWGVRRKAHKNSGQKNEVKIEE